MSTAASIGQNIKTVRTEKGLTQREVCDAAEISTSQLSTYENGKQMVGLVTLAKIATALGTSIDRLYFGAPSEAFLNETEDFGEMVVNCFKKLRELGVVTSVAGDYKRGQASIGKCSYELNRMFDSLRDFEYNRRFYPDENAYLSQLYKSVANQIDSRYQIESDEDN